MNARPAHPALRARTAQALGDLLDRTSNAEIAALLGIAATTVARRGADLRAWPADELLLLAAQDDALAASIRVCVTGEVTLPGQSTAAITDLIEEISDNARINLAIGVAMRDGRISESEAATIVSEIQRRRQHEDEHLLPDLMATITGA